MLDWKNYKILVPTLADDGQTIVLLTKEQLQYIKLMQYARHKKKEAIAERKRQKIVNKTKRSYFNPRLN